MLAMWVNELDYLFPGTSQQRERQAEDCFSRGLVDKLNLLQCHDCDSPYLPSPIYSSNDTSPRRGWTRKSHVQVGRGSYVSTRTTSTSLNASSTGPPIVTVRVEASFYCLYSHSPVPYTYPTGSRDRIEVEQWTESTARRHNRTTDELTRKLAKRPVELEHRGGRLIIRLDQMEKKLQLNSPQCGSFFGDWRMNRYLVPLQTCADRQDLSNLCVIIFVFAPTSRSGQVEGCVELDAECVLHPLEPLQIGSQDPKLGLICAGPPSLQAKVEASKNIIASDMSAEGIFGLYKLVGRLLSILTITQ
ncbi:unnamed protein product [Protopolystoma xenopodis]|uniref:Uncharacterized protein n=1 Tax=Protopolystoma xenopodis TaxID=117903 RepID=A0A3S5CV59_9PLAT|nr:unnamed protein product [Protopolystoma xenopodis]